jgi:O-succinylbenzoate synthase
MAIERIELDLVKLPYVHFFETSFGRSYDRTFSLVKVFEGGVCGWGECVAEEAPLYSGETAETAWHVMKDFLVPLVMRKGLVEPGDYAREAAVFRGNRMAKAGIELALWDLKAKRAGLPLHALYGGVRNEIDAGVSCGIEDSLPELVDRVGRYLEEGYKRIKIKIKPGWDVAACAAVRERFPSIMLQVDANGAYGLSDMGTLKALDAFDLLMIEQPFAPYDLWDHAKLQREMTTPLCLDESIVSFDTARAALEMGSCRIINIKVGRVGGVVETRRIHDHCASREVPVWCGGMPTTSTSPPCRISRIRTTSAPAGATIGRTSSIPSSSSAGPARFGCLRGRASASTRSNPASPGPPSAARFSNKKGSNLKSYNLLSRGLRAPENYKI